MATLNICGWELQSVLERIAGTGTPTYDTTTKRTGAASLRCNPAASAAENEQLGTQDSTVSGSTNLLARTAQTWYTVYFRFEALPSGTIRFLSVDRSAGGAAEVVRLNCSSGGAITLTGTTTSATIATIVAGTWYRLDLRVTSNGTSGAAIDGGTEQTVTANNITQDVFTLGRVATSEAVAFDCYYDDMLISDTGFPGAGEVRQLLPNGAGNYTGWTSGTGSTFAEVDEVPDDTDTTYVAASSTQDNTAITFAMQDTATVGIAGTILAVKMCCTCRTTSIGGTSAVGLRLRSGGTDSSTAGIGEWTTSYTFRAMMFDTDPNGGGAWTSGGVDGIECGVFCNTVAQEQRCTAVSAMVWSAGAAAGITADVPPGLVKVVGVTSDTTKLSAVGVGLIETVGVAVTRLITEAVGVGFAKTLAISPDTTKSASVDIGLIRVSAGQVTTAKSQATGVGLLKVSALEVDAYNINAVGTGLIQVFGIDLDTDKTAEIGVGLTGVFGIIATTVKVQTAGIGLVEVAALAVDTSKLATTSIGLLEVIAIAPQAQKAVQTEIGLVEVLAQALATEHFAGVGIGLMQVRSDGLVESGATAVGIGLIEVAALVLTTAKSFGIGIGVIEVAALEVLLSVTAEVGVGLIDVLAIVPETDKSATTGIGLLGVAALSSNITKIAGISVGLTVLVGITPDTEGGLGLLEFRKRLIINIDPTRPILNNTNYARSVIDLENPRSVIDLENQ